MHPVIAYVTIAVVTILFVIVVIAAALVFVRYIFFKASKQDATSEENEAITPEPNTDTEPKIDVKNDPIPENVRTISGQHCQIFENQCLGRGASGVVYFGMYGKIKAKVAVKVVLTYPPYQADREVDNLKALGFTPGVIGMIDYGFLSKGRRLFMVLHYFEGGMNLENYTKENGNLPLHTAMALFWQLILAVEGMLAAKVVHFSMKPNNLIYYEETKTIRVCDLGNAVVSQGASCMDDGMDFEFSLDDLSFSTRITAILCGVPSNFSYAGDVYLTQLGRCLEYLLKDFNLFYDMDKASNIQDIPTEAQQLIDQMTWLGVYDRMRWKDLYDKEFVQQCKKAYVQQCVEGSNK